MDFYRFSPIEDKEKLYEAVQYTHVACFALCKKVFGKYLPVSGNIGIFCHHDDEYRFLTTLREELTKNDGNWNQKYFRLHEPIVISAEGDIPETTYTYLYIRRPDVDKPEVGDADLVLGSEEFLKIKNVAVNGGTINGVEISYRPDLDMIKLYSPGVDVLPYITTTFMHQKGI